MIAAAAGVLQEVRRLLEGEVKDVNITESVSCVHQSELILDIAIGWRMSGVYSQLVYHHCHDCDDGGGAGCEYCIC